MAAPERWFLTTDGHDHVIDVEPAGLGRRAVWRIDGHEVARRRSSGERFALNPGDDAPENTGVVGLRFGWFGPARRVTWHADGDNAAAMGIGGIDFTPEPGSKAARRDAWIEAHPKLYTVRRTLPAILGIAAALAIGPLVSWLVSVVPWPDWQLPSIPWPDLPSLPLPEINFPDWSMPGWLGAVLDASKYVVPIAVAVILARAEIRRRRRQSERRGD